MKGIDGGLGQTQKFLANLGSDKYGGDLLPTVISLRELIQSFDKRTAVVIDRRPPHAAGPQRVDQQVGPEACRPSPARR